MSAIAPVGIPAEDPRMSSIRRALRARNPGRRVEIVRAWADGPHAFAHALSTDGATASVSTDFFRLYDDGTLAEHWPVEGEFKGPNPSGRTQIDGATTIADPDRTAENKALVKTMLEDCLFSDARPDRIEDYFAEDYLQHNPNVGDGLDIVRELTRGDGRPLTYHSIVLMVGHGNFVATLCEADWEGTPLTQVDILRVQDGKIVEHWDNTAPA